MRPFLTALTATLAACLLIACDAPERPLEPVVVPAAPSAPDTVISPVGAWRVTLLRGEPLPDGITPPRLTIEPDGTASGYEGVNWHEGFLSPHSWDRGVFAYRPGFQTMKAGNQQASEVAARYKVALREATTFTFRSGGLELRDDAGIVILRFEPATPEGRWRLASLRGETVPADARTPTLTIESDGLVSGFTGVNQYWSAVHPGNWFRGGFEVGSIKNTLVGSSREAMDAESRYLRALAEARAFAVRSGALELSDEAGDVILRFEPAAP